MRLRLLQLLAAVSASLHCEWDQSLSAEQTKEMHCGWPCPNPWGNLDPYACGAPSPCCCKPTCDVEAERKEAFLGINWNDHYSKRPLNRLQQFQTLKDNGFYHIKTFTPAGLPEFAAVYGDKGHIYVGFPNKMVPTIAESLESTQQLVRDLLKPYASYIRLVIVGNEPLICIQSAEWLARHECGALGIPSKLLPALRNMHKALQLEGMSLSVTTAFNGGIMEMSANPWTPCVADFKSFIKPLLLPVLDFLRETRGPFLVNIYSWFAATNNALTVAAATGFDTGDDLPRDDGYNYYFNFDMQVDMQRVALCRNNYTDLPLWIGETGWPTGGHLKATINNAYWYVKHVIRRAQGLKINDETKDTARWAGIPMPVFIFEAFDEEKKFEIEHGNRFENKFGLFYEDGLPKWRDTNGMLVFEIPDKLTRVGTTPGVAETN